MGRLPQQGAHALRPPFGSVGSPSDSEDGHSRPHSCSGARFYKWAQGGSPPVGYLGITELGRPSERAPSPSRAGGYLCEGAPPP